MISTLRHHPASRATGLLFCCFGLLFGTWAALIPFVKQRFGLDEAELGILLLCMPAGTLLMNPISVPILQKWGAVKSAQVFLPGSAAMFILPFVMSNVWFTGFSLFLAGMAFSMVNMALNTCASQIEQREGLRIMATCHGLWSAGAMAASAMAGFVASKGVAPSIYIGLIFLLEIAAVVGFGKWLSGVPTARKESEVKVGRTSGFILPNQSLWLLIGISLCTNLTEGTMTDWSAVYLREVVHAPEAQVGWGFAAYAFFMASGRFIGDALIGRFGSRIVLLTGGVVAAIGLLIAVFFQNIPTVLVGFAMVGAGVSLGAPILYAAAAKVPGMAPGAGLATMNTFAMAGFLGGPAFIGFLAKGFGLPTALAIVAGFGMFWAWRASKLSS